MFFKRTMICILILFTVFMITACDKDIEVKMESEIIEDLYSSDFYNSRFNDYSIEELSIIERKTNTEGFSDFVIIEGIITNADKTVQGEMTLELNYGLYDDGWKLDECEFMKGDFDEIAHDYYLFMSPLKENTLSQSEIEDIVKRNYDNAESITVDDKKSSLDFGYTEYYVSFDDIHKYVTHHYNVCIKSEFNIEHGYWDSFEITDIESDSIWDITGEYKYSSGVREYKLSFDEENSLVKYDVSHTGNYEATRESPLSRLYGVDEIEYVLSNYILYGKNFEGSYGYDYNQFSHKLNEGYRVILDDNNIEYKYLRFESDGWMPFVMYFFGEDNLGVCEIDEWVVDDRYNRKYIYTVKELEKIY